MDARWLIDVLRDSDVEGLDALVRDDVRFRSPYTDYEGRAVVTHVLRLVGQVLEDVQPDNPGPSGSEVSPRSPTSRTTRFTAAVQGAPVQGVLCEDLDASGELTEAVLFVRPYRELRTSLRLMRELLDRSPLPEPEE